MKIGSGHLTYCTNIHRGETWGEVRAALEQHVPAIRNLAAPGQRFGVGLRLSAIAAQDLRNEDAFAWLARFLAENDLYVFTLNGFPYGPFHGVRVKEEVYQPDWRTEARVTYTNELADLLVRLLPADPDLEGSISTVPGTFRPLGSEAGSLDQIASNLIRHVAHLVALSERTGRTVALAIEPEPMCLWETIDEIASFIEDRLYARDGIALLSRLAGINEAAARDAMQRHIGVCYDVCHAAVEFEDAAGSLARLNQSGIRIPKLQLSAALRVPALTPAIADELRRFDDGVYLHQVVERSASGLVRYLDLPDALQAVSNASGKEWRIHCHVPIFFADLEHFSTTQDFLREILAIHRRSPISAHLEVETYTWDVLPAELRSLPIAEAIGRELNWVLEQLSS